MNVVYVSKLLWQVLKQNNNNRNANDIGVTTDHFEGSDTQQSLKELLYHYEVCTNRDEDEYKVGKKSGMWEWTH